MKKVALFISMILCINTLFAQIGTTFWVDSIQYIIAEDNKLVIEATDPGLVIADIPETITHNGNTYRVTGINELAFYFHTSLTSVTLPNSIVGIGIFSFNNCVNLTSVTLGDSVYAIRNSAFNGCSSLQTINIPSTLSILEGQAFKNCTSLTSINIPDNITVIENSTFSNCNNLTTVTIGNRVTEIKANAFENCFLLNTHFVLDSIVSIETNAFINCWSLNEITLGENLTNLSNLAFMGCISLNTLNFNAINCTNFTDNNHPFSNTAINTINIGENVQRIPAYFAYGFNQLSAVNIPNSVTEIGEQAFYACSNLSSITIPNNVTSIKEKTFQNCSSLNVITLGSSVDTLESSAFRYCNALQTINCLATTPPVFSDNSVFPFQNSANVKVPCGSLDAYNADYYWFTYFGERITEDCESSLEDMEESALSFYPNPAKDRVSFSEKIERVELIDLNGKTIKVFENVNEINIKDISSGVYFLKLHAFDKTTTQKLIKE